MTDQATLEALDDIENGAWLLIYRKREALAALGELAFDPVRMPARNEEGCCWHPDLPGGVDLDASWQMSALGFDSHFVAMEHDAGELYERYGEEGDLSMVTQWEPTSPGDGWKLAAIYDTEDGPCAMFVRCAALRARLAADDRDLDEALIVRHLSPRGEGETLQQAVHRLGTYDVAMALDPRASPDAEALIERGRQEERDRLAMLLRRLLADAEAEHADNNRRRTFDGWDAESEPASFADARAALRALDMEVGP